MKNKILILLVSLFSIFIISDRVEATTYTVNDIEYTVKDLESFRDYCYYSAMQPSTILIGTYSNGYRCFFAQFNNPNLKWTIYNNSSLSLKNSSYNNMDTRFYYYTYTGGDVSSLGYATGISSGTILYSIQDVFIDDNTYSNTFFSSNLTSHDIESKYENVVYYDIKYYLNNELYDTITVEGGSSHTLKDNPNYDSTTQYWSGWTYDSNIDLSNITSDVNIYGTISDKPIYQVKYYINNELYHTDNVIEGDSYTITDYSDYNSYTHTFSGWTYDSNIDLSNVRQNIDINGTLTEKEKIPVYIDFPITKNDFYSLMVLIGVLILTQIFRVVFPTKGGKDL